MSRRIRLIRRDKLTQAVIPCFVRSSGTKYRRFISFRGHALFDLPLFDQRHSGINNVSSRNHEQWRRFSFYSPVSMDKPDLCRMFFAAARSLFQTCVPDFTQFDFTCEAKFLRVVRERTLTRRWKCYCIERSQIKRVPHIKWTQLCNVLCMRAPFFVSYRHCARYERIGSSTGG